MRKAGAADLLLEIALYDGRNFLALRSGVVNTATQPLRVKAFYPLTAARAFADIGDIEHAKTLNGEGGGRNTTVHAGPARFQFQQRADDVPKRQSTTIRGAGRVDLSRLDEVGSHLAVGLGPSDNAVRYRELNARIVRAAAHFEAYSIVAVIARHLGLQRGV